MLWHLSELVTVTAILHLTLLTNLLDVGDDVATP